MTKKELIAEGINEFRDNFRIGKDGSIELKTIKTVNGKNPTIQWLRPYFSDFEAFLISKLSQAYEAGKREERENVISQLEMKIIDSHYAIPLGIRKIIGELKADKKQK